MIMIVDDHEFNIQSMKVILKSLQLNTDLHLDYAMSGEEAIKKIKHDVEIRNRN